MRWIHRDGVAEIDARYALQTDEGHLIWVRNVGSGERHPTEVVIRVWRVE